MRHSTLLIILLLASAVMAQNDYVIEIKPNKKVIHVDRLQVSENINIYDVLMLLPDLQNQQGYWLLNNYSITVDDKDVGEARDVILNQTRICDVSEIEVSNKPSTSEQKNGQGGVINIKRRKIDTNGLSGEVLVGATTEWDVQPSLRLNYKKDDWTFRSQLLTEYYNHTTTTHTEQVADLQENHIEDTTNVAFKQETFTCDLTYKPTDRDELSIFAWESFSSRLSSGRYGTNSWYDMTPDGALYGEYQLQKFQGRDVSTARTLTAVGNIRYNHKYKNGGEFEVEAKYNYAPNWDTVRSSYGPGLNREVILGGDTMSYIRDNNMSHIADMNISSKHFLIPLETGHKLTLKYGLNASYTYTDFYYHKTEMKGTPVHTHNDYAHTEIYASPFVELNWQYKRIELLAGARYQYYNLASNYQTAETRHTSINDIVTANINLNWQVADHHDLRLVMARDVRRPSVDMTFENLHPAYIHSAEINYIFDYTHDQDYVMTNTSLQYIRMDQQDQSSGTDIHAYSNTISANLHLFYRHSFFTLSTAGSAYFRGAAAGAIHKRNWYYTINVTPIFNLPKDWNLSGTLRYTSDEEGLDYTIGGYFYSKLTTSKRIGNWNIFAQLGDLINATATDITVSDDVRTSTTARRYGLSLALGFSYKFYKD